ncbi:MAG: substrate-binding domain-containing protein [Alphaproteobacteria bacterium]
MVTTRRLFLVFAACAVLAFGAFRDDAAAGERAIVVASTTSTQNSGLFDHILPLFKTASGITVNVVAVGTGQAIRLAKRGDADVLFVHHKPSELAFVADGFGVRRYDVMYNDFVIVGPKSDPAGVRGMKDAAAALRKIAKAGALFASRGDDSGTNKAELALWRAGGVDVAAASGTWYRETGSGMGATLNTAAGLDAYSLSDRGTWLSFQNRRGLAILVEGDPRLFNQYGVTLVNPTRFPHVRAADGRAFIDWLLSDAGQAAIAAYRVNGQQLFFPNAQR